MKILLLTLVSLILSIPVFAATTTPDHVLVYKDGLSVYVDISNGVVAQQIYNQLPVKAYDNGAAVIKDAGDISCYLTKANQSYRCSMMSDLPTK